MFVYMELQNGKAQLQYITPLCRNKIWRPNGTTQTFLNVLFLLNQICTTTLLSIVHTTFQKQTEIQFKVHSTHLRQT